MKTFDDLKLQDVDNYLLKYLTDDSVIIDDNIIPELYLLSRVHGLEGVFVDRVISVQSSINKINFQKIYSEYKLVQSYIYSKRLELVEKLCESKVSFVLMKGFAISHGFYDDNLTRPYSDIDIWIDKKDFVCIQSIFKKNGFAYGSGWNTEPLIRQVAFTKSLGSSFRLEFDVHTSFSSDFYLNKIFSFEVLQKNLKKIYISHINKSVVVPENHFVLLHSLVHLFSHVQKGNLVKLIWIYDIFLMVDSLCEDDILAFEVFTKSLNMGFFVYQALNSLSVLLDKDGLKELADRFKSSDTKQDRALYLLSPKSGFFFLINNLKNTEDLQSFICFLRYTIFPPKVVIERKYNVKIHSILELTYFYFKRALFSLKRYSGRFYEVKK